VQRVLSSDLTPLMAPPRFFWFGEPPVMAFLRLRVAEAGG